MKSKSLVLVLLAASSSGSVPACDLCSIYSAAQAGGGASEGFYSGLAEQFTYISTLQDSGHEIVNSDHEYIKSSVSQLFGGYNFNSRFSLQLNLPMVYRSYAWTGFHGEEWGAGDLSLIGNFVAYRSLRENSTFAWTLLGGLKFPTGDSSWLGPRGDTITALGIGGHDLAMGSGSYDGVIGTGVSARWKRLFMSANTQYAIRSGGDFDHQYANDLTWSGGPGVYLALNHRYTVSLQCATSGEYKGKDTAHGIKDPDSAETIVYVGPQLNFTWSNKISAQAGVDLPVSIYNSDVQAVPDFRVHAAVTYRF